MIGLEINNIFNYTDMYDKSVESRLYYLLNFN